MAIDDPNDLEIIVIADVIINNKPDKVVTKLFIPVAIQYLVTCSVVLLANNTNKVNIINCKTSELDNRTIKIISHVFIVEY